MSATETPTQPAASDLFGRNGLEVPALADYVRQTGHVQAGHDGRLYRYVDGVYRPDGEAFTQVTVRKVLGYRWKRAHAAEVLAYLRAAYPTVTDRPPEQWFNVRNGLLDWRTGTLHEHTPDVVTTVRLPVPYDPSATCPSIDAFIAETFPDDAAAFAYELVAYSMYPGNPLRRAVLLLGPGRNGKTVLLSIIKALLGVENVSSVPLQLLAENRFAAAELYGRLANISGDLDARAIRQTDIFKMATGGDPLMAERKYGAAFTFTPFCTFLFAANEAPISSDQTEAWFDRWVIVPLDKRVPESKVDPHLLAKLTTPDELAGLLTKCVAALSALLDRGAFDLPASVADAGSRYRTKLDTVRGFVDESCTVGPDEWVARPELYRAYKQWCTDSGRLSVSASNFNDHLSHNLAGQVEQTTRRGTRGWSGIGLVPLGERGAG